MSGAYRKVRKRIIYVSAITAFVILAAFFVLTRLFTADTIRKGIMIENTDVSWMTVDEAKRAILEHLAEQSDTGDITLIYGNRKWEVALREIGYEYMVDNALKQAYYIGREGNIFRKLYNSILLSIEGHSINIEGSFDSDKLGDILERIKEECDTDEKNAEITYEDGEITFTREVVKRSLNIERSLEKAEKQLAAKDFSEIELVVDEKKPHIVYEDIKEINGVLSEFSTKFDTNDTNRTDNIKLACSRINGTILLPGESFSMNKALGPRTRENGYKEAPIIFKNELVPGTGGGVCQVSTTLYNTVLLAGMNVIEREHHSIPLYYISPGRDATITENSIDFRFVNNLEYAICLQAGVKGNRLIIRVLGRKKEDDVVYKLKTDIIGVYNPEPPEIIYDNTLKPGEKKVERKEAKGLRVVLYREAYKNGELQWREKLTEDYYKPVRGKIRVAGDYSEEAANY
ncbi:MAG: VanW family protein [Acetivibrionales bacterium]